jgi:hypothetical protein
MALCGSVVLFFFQIKESHPKDMNNNPVKKGLLMIFFEKNKLTCTPR